METASAYRPLVAMTRQPFHTRYLASGEDGKPLVVIKRFEVNPRRGENAPPPPTADRVAHMRRSFFAEMRVYQAFNHPNIMPLLGANEDEETPFLVLPVMPMTLREVLWTPSMEGQGRVPTRLPEGFALSVFRQILTGLTELHGKGMVHRQLAPGAVWLNSDGGLRLDGFGLVKAPDWDVFPPGQGGGPQGFASPQQQTDATAAGPGDDVFSVGRLAYRMLAGRLPDERMLHPCQIDPAISRPLADWAMGCMDPNPACRPTDAAEAAHWLDTAVGQESAGDAEATG